MEPPPPPQPQEAGPNVEEPLRPTEEEIIVRVEAAANDLVAALVERRSVGLVSRKEQLALDCLSSILTDAELPIPAPLGSLTGSLPGGSAESSEPLPNRGRTSIPKSEMVSLFQDPSTLLGTSFVLRFLHHRLKARHSYRTVFADEQLNCDPISSAKAASRVLGIYPSVRAITPTGIALQIVDTHSERHTGHEEDEDEVVVQRVTRPPSPHPVAASKNASPNSPNPFVQIAHMQTSLLGIRHAYSCQEEGNCQLHGCAYFRRLFDHVKSCPHTNNTTSCCAYPKCADTKSILVHYRDCSFQMCPLCVPVRQWVATNSVRTETESGSIQTAVNAATFNGPTSPVDAVPTFPHAVKGVAYKERAPGDDKPKNKNKERRVSFDLPAKTGPSPKKRRVSLSPGKGRDDGFSLSDLSCCGSPN